MASGHPQRCGPLHMYPAGLHGPAIATTASGPSRVRCASRPPPLLLESHRTMPKTFAELMREAHMTVREVSPAEAEALAARGARLVDVREASEWEEGHIPGATFIPKSYLEQQIEGAVPVRAAPVILYCAGGVRSLFAAQTLHEMGYTDVASMSGGFQQWKAEGRAWTLPVVLTHDQKLRYSRHLLDARGWRGGTGAPARLEGAPHRRRRARVARHALPGRRGGRDAGHRRLRRRRHLEPPAPDRPHERSRRAEEDGVGDRDHPCAQPGNQRRRLRGDAHRRERRSAH